jgi:hypothetical protein
VPVIAVTTAIVLDWSNPAPWCAWDEEEVGDEAGGVLVGEGVLVGGEVLTNRVEVDWTVTKSCTREDQRLTLSAESRREE